MADTSTQNGPGRSPPPRPSSGPPRPARPGEGDRLPVPLDAHQERRLAEVQRLAGARYRGWGGYGAPSTSTTKGTIDGYFVEVLDSTGEVERHTGKTLHLAIGAALRALRGTA